MYAIVDISGKQFKVEPGLELRVPHQPVEAGQKITYENVLLMDNGKRIEVGTPTLSGATVQATVVEHGRGTKVTVFKKKRRKGYQVKNTHRQEFTLIKVNSIKEKSKSKKAKSSAKRKTTGEETDPVKGE